MSFQEFCNVTMCKDYITIAELIVPFIHDQHRYEIYKLYRRLLIMINLGALDLDKFVADILLNVKIDLVLQHVLNHVIIFGFQ